MILNDYWKDFLNKNKQLILNNKLDKVYNNALINSPDDDPSYLTQIFYNINIDPLNYMLIVPHKFLYGWTPSPYLNVPSNIKDLDYMALCALALNDGLVINDGITKIYGYSIVDCTINTLRLPKSLIEIARDSFHGSYINNIVYEGSLSDWMNLFKTNMVKDIQDTLIYMGLNFTNKTTVKFLSK